MHSRDTKQAEIFPIFFASNSSTAEARKKYPHIWNCDLKFFFVKYIFAMFSLFWGKRVWDHIHNTSFRLKLTIGPNKLECFITRGRYDLSGTNALAFWAHSYLTKKIS